MQELIDEGLVTEVSGFNSIGYILENEDIFVLSDYKIMRSLEEKGLLRCDKIHYNGKIKLVYSTGERKCMDVLCRFMEYRGFVNVLCRVLGIASDVETNGFLHISNLDCRLDHIFLDAETFFPRMMYFPVGNAYSENVRTSEILKANLLQLVKTASSITNEERMELCEYFANKALSCAKIRDILNSKITACAGDAYAPGCSQEISGESINGYGLNNEPAFNQAFVYAETAQGYAAADVNGMQRLPAVNITDMQMPQPAHIAGGPILQPAYTAEGQILQPAYTADGQILQPAYTAERQSPLPVYSPEMQRPSYVNPQVPEGPAAASLQSVKMSAPSNIAKPDIMQADNLPGTMNREQKSNVISLRLESVSNSAQADIDIEKPVFIIGKQAGKVDAIVNSVAVSRLHCRIIENNGHFFIEDLGSTNGTKVNHVKLQARKKTPIQIGDLIKIADVQFRVSEKTAR